MEDPFKDQWKVQTTLPNGDVISTVSLPSLFYDNQWETCVFPVDGDSNVVARYNTVDEAIKAHCFMVAHELLHQQMQAMGKQAIDQTELLV